MTPHKKHLEYLANLPIETMIKEAHEYVDTLRSKMKRGEKVKYYYDIVWIHDQINFRGMSLEEQSADVQKAKENFDLKHLLPDYIREQRISEFDAFVARPLAEILPELFKEIAPKS